MSKYWRYQTSDNRLPSIWTEEEWKVITTLGIVLIAEEASGEGADSLLACDDIQNDTLVLWNGFTILYLLWKYLWDVEFVISVTKNLNDICYLQAFLFK